MEIIKTSYEEYPIYFNFKNDLVAGETIASFTLTCVDANGNDSSSSIIAASSLTTPKVKVSLKGGVHGAIHKITVKGTASFGNVIEKELWLTIDDLRGDGQLVMQPNDIVLFACDFVNQVVGSGDSISSQSATIIKTSDGSDVSGTALQGIGKDGLKVLIKIGSVTEDVYGVRVKVVTANAEKHQINVYVTVKEL